MNQVQSLQAHKIHKTFTTLHQARFFKIDTLSIKLRPLWIGLKKVNQSSIMLHDTVVQLSFFFWSAANQLGFVSDRVLKRQAKKTAN